MAVSKTDFWIILMNAQASWANFPFIFMGSDPEIRNVDAAQNITKTTTKVNVLFFKHASETSLNDKIPVALLIMKKVRSKHLRSIDVKTRISKDELIAIDVISRVQSPLRRK